MRLFDEAICYLKHHGPDESLRLKGIRIEDVCEDLLEARGINTELLAACKAAHMFIYKDTMSMNVRVQLLDAIARAEGKA